MPTPSPDLTDAQCLEHDVCNLLTSARVSLHMLRRASAESTPPGVGAAEAMPPLTAVQQAEQTELSSLEAALNSLEQLVRDFAS